MMDTFTGAARRLLAVCPPPAAACKGSRNIKTLVLSFYISDPPQLSSIGRTVKDVVSGGETEYLKFHIFPPPTSSNTSRNLRKMLYESWQLDNPPVHFGYVPKLRQVSLASGARAWQAPFVLTECFSKIATNLLELYLNFGCEADLGSTRTSQAPHHNIQKPHPRISLLYLEIDIHVSKHPTILPRRPTCYGNHPKEWKHLNLKLLVMKWFEEEDKVTNYLLLFMECALGLKRIELRGKSPCANCNAIDLESGISHVDEASRLIGA
uniref:FBD domain-containing protein n=1 Tax=Aegilops tauschii TaxID=37682 RepID=N1QTX6_AEGTA